MANNIDIVDLAREIAEIARATRDTDTGEALIGLVRKLLEAADLPPDVFGGGDAPPSFWVSLPECVPA